jgi:hypothetical protein
MTTAVVVRTYVFSRNSAVVLQITANGHGHLRDGPALEKKGCSLARGCACSCRKVRMRGLSDPEGGASRMQNTNEHEMKGYATVTVDRPVWKISPLDK